MEPNRIRLLATDLDGTLLGHTDEFPVYAKFRDVVAQLKQSNDCTWSLCTGRRLASYRTVFKPMMSVGILPDYLITHHAYIYGVTERGHWPHLYWNVMIRLQIIKHRRSLAKLIRECNELVHTRFRNVKTVVLEPGRLCLQASDADYMANIVSLLRSQAGTDTNRGLLIFDHLTHADVRAVPFTKGLALRELSRHLSIDKESILAVGDGLNDITMLNGTTADMTGCPKGAHSVIVEMVHESRGHIARQDCLAGSVEVIEAWLQDKVNSDLPDSWFEKTLRQQRTPPNVPADANLLGCKGNLDGCLFLSAAVSIVMALLAFGMLGPLSVQFEKVLLWLMGKLVQLFMMV